MISQVKLKFFVGVDVSKDTLDICFLKEEKEKPQYYKIPNNEETIESFFKNQPFNNIVVCFESTNNYSITLSKVLTNLKITYSEINSYKASLFLKQLSHIKTDVTDSYGLAVYCKFFSNTFIQSKFNPKYKLIKSYGATQNLLIKIQVQIKNFEKSQIYIFDENLKNIFNDLKKSLNTIIKNLEDIVYKLVVDEIPQTEQILNENKGFGKNLAINLFPILKYNIDKNYKQIILD